MDLPLTADVASRVVTVDATGSTNADLRAHAADVEGWPHLAVLLTEDQTAGRGRLDRSWVAPAGSALAVSVLLRELPASAEALGWIPLIAGAAMSDAVARQLPGHEVGVKWPNDVLVDGRKISGILAEVVSGAVVVGAGVNTRMSETQLPVATATSFRVLGVDVDADLLLADYLRALDGSLSDLASGQAGVSRVHRAVSDRCVTLGLPVTVSLPGGVLVQGIAVRLEDDGRLMVHAEGVDHPVSAGDVVHVRPTEARPDTPGAEPGMSATEGTIEG